MTIEWISIEDRVPDSRRLVLVYGIYTMHPAQKGGFGVSKFNRSRNGGRFDLDGGNWWPFYTTHWAELSEPGVEQVTEVLR
jgi:hypothetical protein